MTSDLENRIKSGLKNSSQSLDTETKQRLQAMRQAALNQPAKKGWLSMFQANYWLPASGLAFCSIMAALLFLPQSQNTINAGNQTVMFESLEEIDMSEVLNDPGFYLWLDELDEEFA